MGKTIDVEGWPPPEGGKGGEGSIGRPPTVVTVAAGLFVVAVILVGMMAVTGRLGMARIDSKEVGVKVNFITGHQATVVTPGYCFYMPFIEEVYVLDKSQQKFVMEGATYRDPNHVPQLTVRASDGSSFYFEELAIQYQIKAPEAETLLRDSGPGEGYKEEWIKAFARSILRDEFGRFSAVEAANPTVFDQARIRATERLNQELGSHGLEVVLIATPNPKFDREYEQAIEDRKNADQEVERLVAELERLEQDRNRQLAKVKREKSVEMQELMGELTKNLYKAEQDRIRIELAAKAYAEGRRLEGEGLQAKMVEEARGQVAKYTKEAEGLASQAQALEQRGEVVVREAIIEKLRSIRFTLVPYSRDPLPKRLEHVDARGATATLVDETVTGDQR